MNIKVKNAILRILFGFVLGTFIGTVILILISYINGGGRLYAVEAHFAECMGSELSAFTLQFFLCGVLGAAFAGGSLIFEVDRWSITRQTLLHLLVTSCAMFPIAYICGWMEPSLSGVLTYVLIFIGIYNVIWIAQFVLARRSVKALNSKLRDKSKK